MKKEYKNISLTKKSISYFITKSVKIGTSGNFIKDRYVSLCRNMMFSKSIIDRYIAFSFDTDFAKAIMIFLSNVKKVTKDDKKKDNDINNLHNLLYLLKDYENFKNDILCCQDAFLNSLMESMGLSLNNLMLSDDKYDGNLGSNLFDIEGLVSKSLGKKELRKDILECMHALEMYEDRTNRKLDKYNKELEGLANNLTQKKRADPLNEAFNTCFEMISKNKTHTNKLLSKYREDLDKQTQRITALSDKSLKMLRHLYKENRIPEGAEILRRDFSEQEIMHAVKSLLNREKRSQQNAIDIEQFIRNDYNKFLSEIKDDIEGDAREYYERELLDKLEFAKNKLPKTYTNEIIKYEQKLEKQLNTILKEREIDKNVITESINQENAKKPKPESAGHVSEVEKEEFLNALLPVVSMQVNKKSTVSNKQENLNKLISSKVENIQQIISDTLHGEFSKDTTMTKESQKEIVTYIYEQMKDDADVKNLISERVINKKIVNRQSAGNMRPVKRVVDEIKNMLELVVLEDVGESKTVKAILKNNGYKLEKIREKTDVIEEEQILEVLPKVHKERVAQRNILQRLKILEDDESEVSEIITHDATALRDGGRNKDYAQSKTDELIYNDNILKKITTKIPRTIEETVRLDNKINRIKKAETTEVTNVEDNLNLVDITNTEHLLKIQNDKTEEIIKNQENRINILNEYVEEQKETINILKKQQEEQKELIEEVKNDSRVNYNSVTSEIMRKIENSLKMESVRRGYI